MAVLGNLRDPHLFPFTRKLGQWLGRETESFFESVGLIVVMTGQIAGFVSKGRVKWKHFADQFSFVGLDTLGVALTMTTFSGMVIALQVATEMVKQGAENYVGALVSMALLRELAPIMTGFSVIAMSGSAYAAELSTMQITSQVDALKVLHVHPVRYLVVPRGVEAITALPIITVITATSGILGGMLISKLLADVHPGVYLDSVWQVIEYKDIFGAMFKAAVFGYLIAMIATSIGINTKGGAKEVGEATTRAVVWSFVAMAIFDYVLTYFIYGN